MVPPAGCAGRRYPRSHQGHDTGRAGGRRQLSRSGLHRSTTPFRAASGLAVRARPRAARALL